MPGRKRIFSGLVLSLGLSLVVLGGTALAAESVLSVSQAVNQALQQNIGLKLAKLSLDSAQITYKKSVTGNPTEVARRSAEIAWEKAQNSYDQAWSDVITGALGSYLNLQSAAFDVVIKEKQAAAAQRGWERTKIYVQKGSASSLDELQSQLTYTSAINALDRARDNYAESLGAYAHMLALDTAPALSNDDFLVIPEFKMTLAEALQTVLKNSLTIKDKEIALELAGKQREQDKAMEQSRFDDQLSQNALTAAELALAKARYDVEEDVTSAYNSLIQAQKALAVAQTSYDIEGKRFEIVKKQYDAGLKTPSDLDSGEVSLLQAQNSLRAAERSYVLSWLAFQGTLGNEINLSGVVKPDASK